MPPRTWGYGVNVSSGGGTLDGTDVLALPLSCELAGDRQGEHAFTTREWGAFIAGVKDGEFDPV